MSHNVPQDLSGDRADERAAAVRGVGRATVKQLFAESGGRCSFPDCTAGMPDEPLEIAHVISPSNRGPRGENDLPVAEAYARDNLIVLCPTHDRVVDLRPEEFTAEVLRRMWRDHAAEVTAAIVRSEPAKGTDLLAEALEFWHGHRENNEEQFWHGFFEERPAILSLIVPGTVLCWHSKCYVGGKQLNNVGSNLLDFLAQGRGNATLLEIKTPASALIGSRCRQNVWKPSGDLIGATMQVLEYRSALLKNLHALASETDIEAPDPACVVLVGDLEGAALSTPQLRSFELYRQALRSVGVITYDEFFSNLQATQDLLSSAR